jgi:hypothetical protein
MSEERDRKKYEADRKRAYRMSVKEKGGEKFEDQKKRI